MGVINLGNDTPVAAMKRGESFWRYQGLVTPDGTATYIPLGPIKPAAIQVGPGSWVDTFRIWSMPPGAPQQAIFQDVSSRAPLVSPISFYTKTVTQTGGNAVTPQLYAYLTVDLALPLETFAGGTNNFPLAPRMISTDIYPSFWVDIIIYFKSPGTFPQGRPMMNNAMMAATGFPGVSNTDNTNFSNRVLALPTANEQIFKVPTYGRQRFNWTVGVDTDMPWQFSGFNVTNSGTGGIYHVIATGTTLLTTPQSYVLTGARYDFVALNAVGATIGTVVDYTFEAED